MTNKGESGVVGKDREWWMIHNVEWHTMVNYKSWWMTDNGEWQIMVNDRQWWMT